MAPIPSPMTSGPDGASQLRPSGSPRHSVGAGARLTQRRTPDVGRISTNTAVPARGLAAMSRSGLFVQAPFLDVITRRPVTGRPAADSHGNSGRYSVACWFCVRKVWRDSGPRNDRILRSGSPTELAAA